MIKIMVALAEALPEIWAENFRTDKKAEEALDEHREHAAKLVAAVELSLKAIFRRLEREDKKDVWAEISEADLRCITTDAPLRVAAAYRKALAGRAATSRVGSVRKQLAIYRDLGVLGGNLAEVVQGRRRAAPAARPRWSARRPAAPARAALRRPHDRRAGAREAALPRGQGGSRARENQGGHRQRDADRRGRRLRVRRGRERRRHPLPRGLRRTRHPDAPLPRHPAAEVRYDLRPEGRAAVGRALLEALQRAPGAEAGAGAERATDEREYLPAWLRRNPTTASGSATTSGCSSTRSTRAATPKRTTQTSHSSRCGTARRRRPGGTGDLVQKVKNLGARYEVIKTRELFGL